MSGSYVLTKKTGGKNMKLGLRKVKVYDELSEETICFTADLYADGKKVATVKNDGRGGSTDVYFTEGWNSDVAKKIAQLAKENPIVYKFDWGEYKSDTVEGLVDYMLDQWLEKQAEGGKQ